MLAGRRTSRDPLGPGNGPLEAEIVRASNDAARSLFVAANEEVQDAFEKQKGVAQELRAVTAAVQRFQQQHSQWGKVLDKVHDALKEIGDVENWLHVIQKDMAHVEETIKQVCKPATDEARD